MEDEENEKEGGGGEMKERGKKKRGTNLQQKDRVYPFWVRNR